MAVALSGRNKRLPWVDNLDRLAYKWKGRALMQTGKIHQMSRYRGFGFIRSDAGSDVFFHRTDVRGMTFDLLKEGQRVKFSVGLSTRGFQALNVELINIDKGG